MFVRYFLIGWINANKKYTILMFSIKAKETLFATFKLPRFEYQILRELAVGCPITRKTLVYLELQSNILHIRFI